MSHLKSSSMSITLTSRDLEEMSFLCFIYLSFFSKKKASSLSKSFIFLCIMIVFLVIFWPGRCILRTIRNEEFNVKVFPPILVFSDRTEHFSLECMTCLSPGFPGLRLSSCSSFFMLQCYSGYCEHKTFRKLNIFIRKGKIGTPNDSPVTSRLGLLTLA